MPKASCFERDDQRSESGIDMIGVCFVDGDKKPADLAGYATVFIAMPDKKPPPSGVQIIHYHRTACIGKF